MQSPRTDRPILLAMPGTRSGRIQIDVRGTCLRCGTQYRCVVPTPVAQR